MEKIIKKKLLERLFQEENFKTEAITEIIACSLREEGIADKIVIESCVDFIIDTIIRFVPFEFNSKNDYGKVYFSSILYKGQKKYVEKALKEVFKI